jgi:hypothetical protein
MLVSIQAHAHAAHVEDLMGMPIEDTAYRRGSWVEEVVVQDGIGVVLVESYLVQMGKIAMVRGVEEVQTVEVLEPDIEKEWKAQS